ncbi:MAG: aminopeptidase P family protein [Gemmobacter sp.]|uniref:M24 family metallopeptidase n=1 Tax=Gemmobacter sp. TaxID=1898957 RepID=UPI001A545048|nr:Xaa-Pro peptidase family protein [Gemmobacter sp.]MBL8562240.1 aminopeptidase P family protein [Gemmobacter sp.]
MSNSDAPEGAALIGSRAARLRGVMRARGVPALLTSQPISILYASGARNMTVFSLMGPFRMLLFFADGPSILYEFAGCEHLAEGQPGVDQVRPAPGLTALSGAGYSAAAARFAAEIADLCRSHGDGGSLAIEGFDPPVSDALRAQGLHLGDATALLSESRRLKTPCEIATMRQAVALVQDAAADLEAAITPGASEVEAWAAFHRHLIATEGEYVSTRLFQSGPRTFPYFQEAGPRRMQAGDLVCFDTDALGWQGYAVDFSRSFLCGDAPPSPVQRSLYARAHDQLQTNAALLGPGVSYEAFARAAWPVPPEHQGWGYYCLAHGLGLCGEFPYVPHAFAGQPYGFAGAFEPGMVICVESYIGAEAAAQGVKLEDQFLITETGVERMTTYPFCARLLG